MSRPIARILAVAALANVACSRWESNAIDLAEVAGAPVVVENISMRHTLSARIGGTPVRLSSGQAPNAINVKYRARVVGPTAAHSAVTPRITCRSGDRAVRTRGGHDASSRLATAAVGTTYDGSSSAPPHAFQSEIPSTCEVGFVYRVQPPLPAATDSTPPVPDPIALGTVCLAAGVLHERPCTDAELPRLAAEEPIDVSEVRARIAKTSGGTFGLALAVLLTAGETPPPVWRAAAQARCMTAGGERELDVPLLVMERDLRPGESMVASTATSARRGLAEAPTRCTLTLQLGVGDSRSTLATYCVDGDTTTAGPCGG